MEKPDKEKRIKAAKKPTSQKWYKATHRLYGSDTMFESWLELCEATIELAEDAVHRTIKEQICRLSDEMLNTAEEYEPETPHRIS